MIIRRCDGCTNDIDPQTTHYELNRVVSEDEWDDEELMVLPTFTTEAEYHFCSAVCLLKWAGEQVMG